MFSNLGNFSHSFSLLFFALFCFCPYETSITHILYLLIVFQRLEDVYPFLSWFLCIFCLDRFCWCMLIFWGLFSWYQLFSIKEPIWWILFYCTLNCHHFFMVLTFKKNLFPTSFEMDDAFLLTTFILRSNRMTEHIPSGYLKYKLTNIFLCLTYSLESLVNIILLSVSLIWHIVLFMHGIYVYSFIRFNFQLIFCLCSLVIDIFFSKCFYL